MDTSARGLLQARWEDTALQRKTAVYTLAVSLILALGIPAAHNVTAQTRPAHAAGHADRVTACGVERWRVKIGMDPDARLVKQNIVIPTTIVHLRSLRPPATLPRLSRVRPVETTVWAVDAILLRYRVEEDSDVHLVIADTGGRTMISEIPAPQCVGSGSPFLAAIRVVRRAFVARFHPTDVWQRPRLRVHVVGVGFFDYKHGQSGVAPNAIELHPVLAISWGGASAVPPSATATPRPATGTGANFSVRAYVTPNPVACGASPTLYARTVAGAVCTANVVYSTGRPPRSFDGSARTVGSSGVVSWTWHMESKGTGGTATVTCSFGGQTRSATTNFAIA
jgi:hypothetical protein